MLDILDISGSALYAGRIRMDTIANNLANAQTTRDVHGNRVPFRRKMVIFRPWGVSKGLFRQKGVSVPMIVEDKSPFRLEYNPHHPDAVKPGENIDLNGDGKPDVGFVQMPNINPLLEMVDMINATRAYEANVSVIDATKSMFNAALRILA